MFVNPSIKFVLASSLTAATLTGFALPARAGEYRAIAAGVARGVAGSIAGESLSGALPPAGYYGPNQQQPQCCVGAPPGRDCRRFSLQGRARL